MRTFNIAILAITLLGLSGCISPQPVQLNAEIKIIDNKDLPQYWVASEDSKQFYLAPTLGLPADTKGKVLLRFLIDSNGRVWNPEVVESTPADIFDDAAAEVLKEVRFEPAPGNSRRQPVQVNFEVDFTR